MMGKRRPEEEIGRELKASELKPGTIVFVKVPPTNLMATFWVEAVDLEKRMAVFYSGMYRWHVINFIQPDGSIHDDKGRVVHVFEYLGEI
jgi:hypothetical protein